MVVTARFPPVAFAATVTCNNKTSNNDKTFFVQVPTSVRRDSLSDLIEIANGNVVDGLGVTRGTNKCGAYRNVVYQLMDQDNPAQPILAALELDETFSGFAVRIQICAPDTNAILNVPILGNRVDRFEWNGSSLTFDHNLIMLRAFQNDGAPLPPGQGDAAQPATGNHDGGVLRFGPDGKLYILFGDNGRPFLADFGISLAFCSLSSAIELSLVSVAFSYIYSSGETTSCAYWAYPLRRPAPSKRIFCPLRLLRPAKFDQSL